MKYSETLKVVVSYVWVCVYTHISYLYTLREPMNNDTQNNEHPSTQTLGSKNHNSLKRVRTPWRKTDSRAGTEKI